MKIASNEHLVLASHNAGKLTEMQQLLKPFDVTITSSKALGFKEPVEDGSSFKENALIKAYATARQSQKISIADDSGFCVEALDGAPGIYSARWAYIKKHHHGKIDIENIQKEDLLDRPNFTAAMQYIHERIKNIPNKKASFVTVLAVVWPSGEEKTYQGRVEGEIIDPARGTGGFGYDPIFVPSGEIKSFAEMGLEDKQKISHRGRAFQLLINDLFH